MQRRVNNLQVFLSFDNFWVNTNGLYHIEIHLIYLFADNLYQWFITIKLYIRHLYLLYLVDNTLVVRSQNLCSVFPIGLITVIFFGVMTRCNVNTALAFEMSDGERTLGSGAHIIKKIHLNIIRRENVGNGFGKQTAVITTVMTNNYRDLRLVWKVLFKIIGQSLCSHAHRIDVHSVTASSHNTP